MEAGTDGGTTTCGTKVCNTASEICVMVFKMVGTEYTCEPVPSGCESNRSCSCVGATICLDPFDTCSDIDTPNVVSCECVTC